MDHVDISKIEYYDNLVYRLDYLRSLLTTVDRNLQTISNKAQMVSATPPEATFKSKIVGHIRVKSSEVFENLARCKTLDSMDIEVLRIIAEYSKSFIDPSTCIFKPKWGVRRTLMFRITTDENIGTKAGFGPIGVSSNPTTGDGNGDGNSVDLSEDEWVDLPLAEKSSTLDEDIKFAGKTIGPSDDPIIIGRYLYYPNYWDTKGRNRVLRYHLDEQTYTVVQATPNIVTRRMTSYNGLLFLLNAYANLESIREFEVYSPVTGELTVLPPMMGISHVCHHLIAFDGKIYPLFSFDPPQYFDIASRSWHQGCKAFGDIIAGRSLFSFGDNLYLSGVCCHDSNNNIYRYDSKSQTCQVVSTLPQPMDFPTLHFVNDQEVIVYSRCGAKLDYGFLVRLDQLRCAPMQVTL